MSENVSLKMGMKFAASLNMGKNLCVWRRGCRAVGCHIFHKYPTLVNICGEIYLNG